MSDRAIADGGGAFPLVAPGYAAKRGMSLRDYFAAAALQGLVIHEIASEIAVSDIAAAAYRIADAMIAERRKTL